MRQEVLLAGFGGQGIISTAILIASAIGKYEGKYVAQAQSYGPEARGGACKSEVVIDEEEIDYIKTLNPDIFIVMSQPALDKYISRIDPEHGVIIADSSLIKSIPEQYKNVYMVPVTDIAEQKLGARIVANVVILGCFARISGYVKPENCEKAIVDNMAAKFHELNKNAFHEGYDYVDAMLKQE